MPCALTLVVVRWGTWVLSRPWIVLLATLAVAVGLTLLAVDQLGVDTDNAQRAPLSQAFNLDTTMPGLTWIRSIAPPLRAGLRPR